MVSGREPSKVSGNRNVARRTALPDVIRPIQDFLNEDQSAALNYKQEPVLKFGNGNNSRKHFASGRGPTVAPPKDYAPNRNARKPPFYAEIGAASNLADDSPEFRTFVRDIVGVPEHMAPSVAAAIRQQKWKISPNPLGAIRTAAHQEAQRTLHS